MPHHPNRNQSLGGLYPHKQPHLYQSLDLPELCCQKSKDMEDWQEILQKIEQSGLSIAQYCRENDIKPHTVRYWKQKLVKQETPGFVRISTSVPAQSMEIIYPSGVRLKLYPGIAMYPNDQVRV